MDIVNTPDNAGDAITTKQEAFRKPLLESISELGGSAPMQDVINLVEHKMRHRLTKHDQEIINNGRRRWDNSVRWLRQGLCDEGLLKKNSPRGIWELTDKGHQDIADNQPCEPDENLPSELRPYTISNILKDGCFLEESHLAEILDRLKTKKNLILQGPPGTGEDLVG